MSNPPYGSGYGPSGSEPEDDWFRPAPQAREEIYRESQYGNSTPPSQQPYQNAPYDDYGSYGSYANGSYANGNGSQPYDPYGGYDDPYGSPGTPGAPGAPGSPGVDALSSLGRPSANGSAGYGDDYGDGYGYGDPQETMLDGPPIRHADTHPGMGSGGDRPGDGDGNGDGGGKKPGREGWKKYLPNWKIVAGVCALGLVASITLVVVGYTSTPTPDLSEKGAQKGATDQGSNVYWANSNSASKPIFRLGQPRENVDLEKIPLHVRQAVMAAEQRDFETEPGVSPRGLARVAFKAVTGGDIQGGSTITQQLARNYLSTLNKDRNIGRKFKEIFTALKLEKKYSKDEILEKYLNTIPFGRQADGIQAASRAYFHTNIDKLNVAQGALLAAMIQQPYYFCSRCDKGDPRRDDLEFRWNYVLDGMVKKGWLSEADRAKQQFPKTKVSWVWTAGETGQTSYIRDRVNAELASIPGFDDTSVNTGGYKIYTSLNQKLMQYAEDAVKTYGPKVSSSKIRTGFVAVNSKNGEIVAFYGGNPKKNQSDAALVERPQVGSSFKPYVLATALSQNINVKSLIEGRGLICLDGTTGDLISGARSLAACEAQNGYWMRSTHSIGQAITLVKATEQSINSSFVRLGLKVGMDNVVDTAVAFGLPRSELHNHASLPLGTVNISALEQAGGYAAFANGGTAVTPHIITKITKMVDGKEVEAVKLPWSKPGKRVLTEDQAAQATVAMRAVVTSGTGTQASLGSRPVAGKTGTTDEGAATWFVGYTPQLSAASTVFHQQSKPMTPYLGSGAYGGEYSARIWRAFMEKALNGKEIVPFPDTSYSGQIKKFDTPKPKPTKTEECNPLMQLAGQCGDNQGDQGQQDLPGCQEGQLPPQCDPNKPPPGTEGAPPAWWCAIHPEYAACQANNGNGNGNGNGNNQVVDNDHDGVPADQDPDDNNPNVPNQQQQQPHQQ